MPAKRHGERQTATREWRECGHDRRSRRQVGESESERRAASIRRGHESIGVLEHIPGIVGATDALGTCIGIRAVPLRRRSNAAHCGDSGLATLYALTSDGMMTWRKITGSGL